MSVLSPIAGESESEGYLMPLSTLTSNLFLRERKPEEKK